MSSVQWQRSLFFSVLLLTTWSTLLIHIPKAGAQAVGGSYRRPLAQNPTTLDPHRPNDIYGRTVAQQLYDGLVQYDESLSIKPAIAISWKASRDGLTWTFSLRRGVKFHHGREVTAEDFVYSFTRILNPVTKSAGAPLFARIKGAKDYVAGKSTGVQGLQTVDKYTLRVILEESTIPFVAIAAVGFAKVVPREIMEQRGEDFGRMPIGTGPFKFVEWVPHKHVVLEANPDYFEGRPYLDKLEYRIFSGDVIEQMFAEFERGHLEDTAFPAKVRQQLIQNKKYHYIRRPILGIRFLGFNTTAALFHDPRVRQAITSAIDRSWIAKEIYKDIYPPGVGILPPGTYGYDPSLRGYPYDPDKAKTLLAQAGFPSGRGLPPIRIWSAAKFDEAVAELEAITRYLSAVGIKAEVHYNTRWPEYKQQVYAGTLPIFRYSWYADTPDPDTFLSLFHSQNADNLSRYKNPELDRMIFLARQEQDYIKKVKMYQEIEKKLVDEAPILVLGYYSYERIFQPYVKGIKVSALGDPYIPMKNIWLEKPSPAAAKQ